MQTGIPPELKSLMKNLWISPDKSFIYLSVPKCGCTSVKYFIRSLYEDVSCINNLHDINESTFICGSELSYDELRLIAKDAYFFSIIREPRERVLSAYLDKFKLMHLPNLRTFLPQLTGSAFNNDQESIDFARSLTFHDFLLLVSRSTTLNEHWAPFNLAVNSVSLLSDNLEVFDLSHIGIPLYYLHKSFGVRTNYLPKNYFSINKRFGHFTGASARLSEFYSSEVVSLFERIYNDDISLWKSLQTL